MKLGGRPGGYGQQPFTPKELCKFFLTGSCHKGAQCTFSHNLADFPCKYLHATGYCEKGEQCKFSHKILQSDEEINRFIDLNEAFLADLLKKNGTTNLGEYYLKRVRDKEEANTKLAMQNLMIPPSLMSADPSFRGANSLNQFSAGGAGLPNLLGTTGASAFSNNQFSSLLPPAGLMGSLLNLPPQVPNGPLGSASSNSSLFNQTQSSQNLLNQLLQPSASNAQNPLM